MSSSFFSNNKLQIKICGLKTAEDAETAIHAGADALGFNFYPSSKRFAPLETALKIIESLPRQVARIAVVVNPTAAEIQSLLETNVWDAIQFHGEESPEFCQNSKFPIWIKAVQVHNFEQAQEKICSFPTPYILLDAYTSPHTYGGTGTLINLPLAARLVQAFPKKHFLLAGGLRPENVREAVQTVNPFAVDVASGVENVAGRKDSLKMRAFVESAHFSC